MFPEERSIQYKRLELLTFSVRSGSGWSMATSKKVGPSRLEGGGCNSGNALDVKSIEDKEDGL